MASAPLGAPVEIVSGLLAGEYVKYSGALYTIKAQVTVFGATQPPVLVVALGPAMLRLYGKLAYGTIT